ncbi:heme oxygenase-like protein [Micromonospora pisi]|uniref:Heme oxygenase-like protein n=1 Tax=Micromonospora pisi TaxID=589240 RepID=A0A495JEN9_9ACTN|nr:iron-containing redox enzyme family protein [Micromonospora pisi]RKR87375.1 heme oxygenase-like protein [Micromonospora pisi]
MRLPVGRGPASAMLVEALSGVPGRLSFDAVERWRTDGSVDVAAIGDEDLQLFLFTCYELHYRGWDGVDERWEWEPSLLAVRAVAEHRFESALRRVVGPVPAVEAADVPAALGTLVADDDGPSLAAELHRRGDLARFREFVAQRSVYHLREADPHSWGIPRLDGPAKAALVEIQMDEYGHGQLPRMHAELFRDTMRWLGLDTGYHAYVDSVPAVTLAANNLISLFGLHRRWRGALLGHLAAFEMTSSLPNRRYGDALRRLGGPPEATRFYDEHVVADAVHEQIATYDLCGSFAAAEPARAADVLFGAACCLTLDRLVAEHMLASWARERSSLRLPIALGH